MEIIDCHTHLIKKDDVIDHRNIPFVEGYRGTLDDELPVEFLISEMDRAGISRSVILCAPPKSGFLSDRKLIAQAITRYPDRLLGLATCNPFESKDPVADLRRAIEDDGFKGLGEWGYFDYTDPICFPIYEACIELDVPALIHVGAPLPCVPIKHGHPNLLDEVIVRYPELKVIAAHCGLPWFLETVVAGARCQNMWIDISAFDLYPSAVKLQAITTIIAAGLGDRMLFGSDFPVTSPVKYSKWVKKLKYVASGSKLFGLKNFGQKEFQDLMSGNAKKLFKV